jgi:L-alanine-DL-glutamate epimerase-like enolase superfamily enzyme
MKIASLRTGVVGTPWRNLTFVEVRTDEGLTGVGETRMLNHTDALLGYLAEAEANHVLGSDPFEIESLVQRMYHRDYARAGQIVMRSSPRRRARSSSAVTAHSSSTPSRPARPSWSVPSWCAR